MGRCRQRQSVVLWAIALAWFAPLNSSIAQHPIDIQRKTAGGEHFEAMVLYEKMPKRRVTKEARISAAKSSWALGLVDKAIAEFDNVSREKKLSDIERAQIYLSRGIIEYQEERAQIAILYAEKVISHLKQPGALRSKAWLLWGESLYQLGSYGAAEDKYQRALSEAATTERPDIQYRLGLCYIKLGEAENARLSFEQVPLDHERTPSAIRHLAQLAIEADQLDHAEFWLQKGRQEFPDRFLDSWVDYALLQVAIKRGDVRAMRKIRSDAEVKYPPSDDWFTLLSSAAEAYEWESEAEMSKSMK